jgi:hypothetical protein
MRVEGNECEVPEHFGSTRLHEISPLKIDKWRGKKLAEGLSKSTINSDLSALKADLRLEQTRLRSRADYPRTAVILIDTRTLAISTPSLATARVGGSAAKNLAYSSFKPAKSAGLVKSTRTSTTSASAAPAERRILSQFKRLSRLLLDPPHSFHQSAVWWPGA